MADGVYSVGSIQSGYDISPAKALPIVSGKFTFLHILYKSGMLEIWEAFALKLKLS
jgi:hypothetical protein